jgi:hypothetical protein
MGLFGLLNEEQDKFIPQLIAQAKKNERFNNYSRKICEWEYRGRI